MHHVPVFFLTAAWVMLAIHLFIFIWPDQFWNRFENWRRRHPDTPVSGDLDSISHHGNRNFQARMYCLVVIILFSIFLFAA